METIRWSSVIDASVDDVWAFHMDPHNLARVSPGGAAIKLLTPDARVALNCRISIRIDVMHLVPLVFDNVIVEFDPPTRFVDEQVKGPFRLYRHEHLFEALEQGTRMTDVVSYETPGFVGQLADKTWVRMELEKILKQRHDKTAAILKRS